ncbi:MAG: transcriptional regulator, partial [Rhizobacter sp.]
RFACPCVDWSERRAHLAGSLGAALLQALLQRGWLQPDEDSRALSVTAKGRRAFEAAGITPAPPASSPAPANP